jgi:hypothetical protein
MKNRIRPIKIIPLSKREQALQMVYAAIKMNEQEFIAIKPFCGLLNILYKYQLERIKADPIMAPRFKLSSFYAADNKRRKMAALDKGAWLRWIYTMPVTMADKEGNTAIYEAICLIHKYYESKVDNIGFQEFLSLSLIKQDRKMVVVTDELIEGDFFKKNKWPCP